MEFQWFTKMGVSDYTDCANSFSRSMKALPYERESFHLLKRSFTSYIWGRNPPPPPPRSLCLSPSSPPPHPLSLLPHTLCLSVLSTRHLPFKKAMKEWRSTLMNSEPRPFSNTIFPVLRMYVYLASLCTLYMCIPGEAYRRRLRSLMLGSCDVIWVLINSLVFNYTS